MGDVIDARDRFGKNNKEKPVKEKKSFLEKITRFFAKHWFSRKLFFLTYRCPKCGKELQSLSFEDLGADLKNNHLKAETAWAFSGFAYRCPDMCSGEYVAYMIM